MNTLKFSLLSLLTACACFAELKINDQPLWVFPGQQFRICLEQPADSGLLAVEYPCKSLVLFDRWDKDQDQRFYFKAEQPGEHVVHFRGNGGTLDMTINVIPWSDIYEPRKLGKINLPRIWPVGNPGAVEIKNRHTALTEQQFATMAESCKNSKLAKQWIAMSDEEVFNIVPGATVPRTCLIVLSGVEEAVGKGCPVCGTEIYKGRSGFYPWLFEPEKEPWKVICPNCKTAFPSNDWRKGDMHSGDFPDDGFGCQPVTPVLNGKGIPWRWPFIAYYHQTQAYMRELTFGILETAVNGVANNDQVAIHKAAIAMFKYAESMLDMAVNLNHRKRVNRDGILFGPVGAPKSWYKDGLGASFLYIQPNWDTTKMRSIAKAWDCIFDKLDDDSELIEFCQKHYHPEIKTIDDFKKFIDAGVLRVEIQAALDNAVARNFPQQESMAIDLALCYGQKSSLEIADWLLNKIGLRFALVNQYYKDGAAHESMSYNTIQINNMAEIFRILDRLQKLYPEDYVPPRLVSMQNDPKFRRQYEMPFEFSTVSINYPVLGDIGVSKVPRIKKTWQGYPLSQTNLEDAYDLTGDERFLQAMNGYEGSLLDQIGNPELRAKAEETGKRLGWHVDIPSNILDGYGQAILRSGKGKKQRAAWLNYSRFVQHHHPDMLTWGYDALERVLLPDLGYPEGWTYSTVWEAAWGTHYMTHVTGISSNQQTRGELTAFGDQAPFQFAVAETGKDDNKRERAVMLVDISEDESYALTVENVIGGTEHINSFHLPWGEIKTDAISDSTDYETALAAITGTALKYGDYKGVKDQELACLSFMKNPKKLDNQKNVIFDVALKNQNDANIRAIQLLPENVETYITNANPPGGGSENYDINWIITRNHSDKAPLKANYAHIIHQFEKEPSILDAQCLPVLPAEADTYAVCVTCKDFKDYIVIQRNSNATITVGDISTDAAIAFVRCNDNSVIDMRMFRGTFLNYQDHKLSSPAPSFVSSIAKCDWQNSTIQLTSMPAQDLTGKHIRITNELGNSVSYIIKQMERSEDTCSLKLDMDPRIGESFIAETKDNAVRASITLRLAAFQYYDGKTLANEDGTQYVKIKNVTANTCNLAENLTKAELDEKYKDVDGDDMPRMIIYDYGPGDQVQVDFSAFKSAEN